MVPYYRHTHIHHTKKRVEDVYNAQSESKQTQKPDTTNIDVILEQQQNSFSEENKHTLIGASSNINEEKWWTSFNTRTYDPLLYSILGSN